MLEASTLPSSFAAQEALRLAERIGPARWASPTLTRLAMSAAAPHYLLFTEANAAAARPGADQPLSGRWRFVLADAQGLPTLEAEDHEPAAGPERLELLALIRGLEAIESPSGVRIVSPSPRLRRALEQDLARWKAEGWQWERFGRMVPIKNRDLWQRLDRLLEIHTVHWGPGVLDPADDLRPPPQPAVPVVSRHLVRGERRLRIDQPMKHRGFFNASPSSKESCSKKSVGRLALMRQAATRSPGTERRSWVLRDTAWEPERITRLGWDWFGWLRGVFWRLVGRMAGRSSCYG